MSRQRTAAPGVLQVLDVARGVLEELDLDVVLERVVEAARELSQARYGALGVLDRSRTELERFITSGVDELTRQRIGPLPRGKGLLGELIENPVALRPGDVGAHPHSYGFPAEHPAMKTFLGVPVMVGGQPFGNLYLTEKASGEQFSEDDERAVLRLAELAGVAIDHASRHTTTVERQRAELKRTVDALGATIQIARALGGETDLARILSLVAKRGRALVSARALLIEQEHAGEMVIAAAAGELPEGVLGQRVDLHDSLAAAALRTRRTLRVEEAPNRPRFERHGIGRLGVHAGAGLVVPLLFRGQGHGVPVVVDRVTDGPTVHRGGSAAPGGVRGQRGYRDRDGRDARGRAAPANVGGGRAGTRALGPGVTRRDAAKPRLAAGRARSTITSRVARAADQCHRGSGRSAAERYRQPPLAGHRASTCRARRPRRPGAIRDLADRARSRGLEVEVMIDLAYENGRAPDRYTSEFETAIYRIVQESLTNAGKHGEAKRATVRVEEDETTVRITVQNDGRGFDTTARSAGFGLLGMHERAGLLDGTLEIQSAPGQGTTVRAVLPARRRATQAA